MILPVQKTSVKTYWKTTFKGPMFIRGSPYNTTHITTVWAHTTTVWADETTVWVNSPVKTYWKTPVKGPMFIRGSPYKIIHITTVWTLENNFQGTMFIRVPPIKQLPSVEFVMFNSTFIYSVLVYYSVLHLRYNTLNRSNTNKSTKRPQRIDQLKKKSIQRPQNGVGDFRCYDIIYIIPDYWMRYKG